MSELRLNRNNQAVEEQNIEPIHTEQHIVEQDPSNSSINS